MALTAMSWLIITTHTVWFTALGTEMWRFWSMRKKLKIHARSPMLAMMSGAGGMFSQFIIMIFELCAQQGVLLPCPIMLHTNAIVFGMYAFPYLLRGLRVVIISDKAWRAKYSAVLSRNTALTFIFAAMGLLWCGSLALHFLVEESYGPNPTRHCFIIAEWWFYGPVAFTLAGCSSKLFLELSRVNDRIHMSSEISSAALSWLGCAVPFYGVYILNDFGVLDTPRQWNFVATACMMFTLVSTFFLEPRRSKGKIQICVSNKKKKVVVVVDEPQIEAWKGKWYSSRIIMDHSAMDEAFEKHVQDYLCSESYDFLKELDSYIESAATIEVEPQFLRFREIINMYIMPGSELEVNIETAMRNKILKIGEHDKFVEAEFEVKRDIFNPSGTEIRKMLDENLLKTFLASPGFLDLCKRLDEEAEQEQSVSTMVDAEQLNATVLVPFDEPVDEEDVD